jgi:hypothetical protein
MTVNPYKHSTQTAKRFDGRFSLDIARVTEVADDAAHQVQIEILSPDTGDDLQGGPIPATVSVQQSGDIAIPSVGDVVIVGRFRNRRPVVLGTVYTRQTTLDQYQSGERTIGHPPTDAQIQIAEDGTINIDSDGGNSVFINGNTPVFTDTDTHIDVLDDGAPVASDITELDFSDLLEVSDQGGGTVRVTADLSVLKLSGTSTNINSSSWTQVTWDSADITSDQTDAYGSGSTLDTVVMGTSGIYEIYAEADFTSGGGSRANPNFRIMHNGTQVGVMGRSGYMRDNEGHNHSSVHAHAVIEVGTYDDITVEAMGEADTGNSITPDNAHLIIKRIGQ